MLKNMRARGNKWILAGATLLALVQVTGAGQKWV
jgi:hypothetical protein